MALREESKVLGTRMLQKFARETRGRWSEEDLAKLVERVRKAGFTKIDEARMRRLLENNRERWLAGDDSVGPPPPGALRPAAGTVSVPGENRRGRGDIRREAGREKEKMPEQRPQPPRGGPPRPAAGRPAPARPAAAPARPAAAPARPAAAPARPAAAAAAPSKSARSLEGAAAPAVPGLNPNDVDIDSGEAQEQHTRRLAVIKRSQDLAKESMDTEVEVRKQEMTEVELQRNLDRLEARRGPLEAQRKKLQEEVDNATRDIAKSRASIDTSTTKRAELEESVGHRKRERSEHVAAIAGFKAEKEGLIT